MLLQEVRKCKVCLKHCEGVSCINTHLVAFTYYTCWPTSWELPQFMLG